MVSFHSKVKEVDRTYHIKLAIRALNTVLAIVTMSLISYLILQWSSMFGRLEGLDLRYRDIYGKYALTKAAVFQLLSFIPLGLTVVSFIVAIMFYTLRKRPIHPGWMVAFDLLSFLGFITWTYFTFPPAYTAWHDYDLSVRHCPGMLKGYFTDCNARYVRAQLASSIFTMMLIFPTFVLFIWSIFDTSARRHEVVGKRMADDMIATRDLEQDRRRGRMEEESVI